MCAKYYTHCYNTRTESDDVVRALCSGSAYFFFRFFSSSSLLFDFYSFFPFSFPSSFSCARFSATCTVPIAIGTLGFFSPLRNEVKLGSVRLRAAARDSRERRSTTLTGICDVTAVSSRNAIIRCVCVCVQAEYRNTFTGVGEISYSIFCQ